MTAAARFRAWSSTVRLVVTDDRALPEATAYLRALLDDVDVAASRFRPDSVLSRANAHAGRPVAVSRELVALVRQALTAARDTDGMVDPTVGGDLAALGYDRDIALIRGRDVGPRAALTGGPRASWRDVALDDAAGLLTVPAGTLLDLGATAKAATADRAAATLHTRFGCGVLVELGGDLAVAGPAPAADGWAVAVAEHEGGPAEQVFLDGGGLATSTTTVRAWRSDGVTVHHVIDPRTGLPAGGPWRTVTVAAPSALAANVASTAALVLGDGAVSWLARRDLDARLVASGGAVRTLGGWPEPGGRAAQDVSRKSMLCCAAPRQFRDAPQPC
ncbi:FAD:protein FMN transferase [Jatrophihabitans sp. YIM 134969]